MNDHEHDYWRTRSGALVCACGARRPLPEGDIMPAPELTPAERAIVDRFGIHDETGPTDPVAAANLALFNATSVSAEEATEGFRATFSDDGSAPE